MRSNKPPTDRVLTALPILPQLPAVLFCVSMPTYRAIMGADEDKRHPPGGGTLHLYGTPGRLQIDRGGAWRTVDRAPVAERGWTAHLRVENWDSSRDRCYPPAPRELGALRGHHKEGPGQHRGGQPLQGAQPRQADHPGRRHHMIRVRAVLNPAQAPLSSAAPPPRPPALPGP